MELNNVESSANRDAGMQQAADNTEAHRPGWQALALAFLQDYPEKTFQAEQVREWAYMNGLQRPSHGRAWGAVIVTAKNQGLIRHAGYAPVSNPKAHRTPASVWVKV